MSVGSFRGIIDTRIDTSRKSSNPFAKRLSHRFFQGAASSIGYIVRRMSENASYKLADQLGAITYNSYHTMRARAIDSLRTAFGDNRGDLEQIARRSFQLHTRSIVEVLRSSIYTTEDIKNKVSVKGIEHLNDSLSKGNGAILLSAHYGNWEFIGMRIAADGYPLHALVRDQAVQGIDAIINSARMHFGAKIIERGNTRGLLRCLRNNNVLGILPDQNEASGGVFTDFFGKPAATATGPAVLSIRTGAPIIPVFISRDESNHHLIVLHPPMEFSSTGNTNDDVFAYTAAINKVIEKQIASNPVEWLWIHQRWKRRPNPSGR